MRRPLALVLIVSVLLAGCTQTASLNVTDSEETVSTDESILATEKDENSDNNTISTASSEMLSFSDLDDENLLTYIEDKVYDDLISELDDEFFVENVEAIYISKEYLEELSYNSQSNIFFGYTLAELEELFQGTCYIFTLNDNGETTVQELETVYDDTFERTVKNVAVGGGIILLCVTVSVTTAGLGMPAASMIFAASAKTGTVFALSSGVFSAASAAIVKAYQTHDMSEALKEGFASGSEGFKWGAITGVFYGGIEQAVALHGATLNGLTMDEAAKIQQESKYPLDIIKQFKSMDEYNIYKEAGLKVKMVSGKTALVRDIDLNYVSEYQGKPITNLELMKKGLAPKDPMTGKPYQLHHVNQSAKGTLAILTESEHQGNSAILNIFGKESEIDHIAFRRIRQKFWKDFAAMVAP